MTATSTFDVFSSLDGLGSATGDWTGYWGKQGPELLAGPRATLAPGDAVDVVARLEQESVVYRPTRH